MQPGEPSRTALGVAAARAAHQLLEGGRIFTDPLALAIVGQEEAAVRRFAEQSSPGLRLFLCARSAVAEAAVAQGVAERDVRQVVVLGAGLDTFAYRNPHATIAVFEVDFPATQAWKRQRLAQAGIAIPSNVTFTGVDFERDGLMERLVESGFDPARRSLFIWLGVIMYLTDEAITATLCAIASCPGGAEVVFDYSDPVETLSASGQAERRARAVAVASAGEPMKTTFEPTDLHARLTALGLPLIKDLGPPDLEERYIRPGAAPSGRTRGGHVLHAMTA